MATKWFDDVESLKADISKSGGGGAYVPAPLVSYVQKKAEYILKSHIKSDIYGAYTPKKGAWKKGSSYEARGSLLNVYSTFIDDGSTILVTVDAEVDRPIVKNAWFDDGGDPGGSFLKLMEAPRGKHGIWKRGKARPAVKNAQKEVNSDKFWNDVNQRIKKYFG